MKLPIVGGYSGRHLGCDLQVKLLQPNRRNAGKETRMREPTTPPDEAQRLQSLVSLNILDTPAEERFDRITRLARRTLNVSIAAISLVDRDRQWFKSAQGLDVAETDRAVSFCGHAIHGDATFVVPDATRDERFADNPLVVGGPEIRAYVGRPIKSPDGHRIGTLCVIDDEPRNFAAEDLDALNDLAAIAESELRADALAQTEKQLRNQLSEAERRASIDPLTRCWNREVALRILADEIERSIRGRLSIGVMLIDIDNLKAANDGHGHLAGDQLLREAAGHIRTAIRSYDSVGRYGGDEFLAVLPDCDGERASAVGERLRTRLARWPVKTATGEISITVSIGVIVVTPQNPVSQESLIELADKALYEAKRSGRDRVVLGARVNT